jgi:RecB family endonuclease NucS
MRLVIARCSVDYVGRVTAHLAPATRLLLIKADGSVSIHADDRAYKPLNWMSPPCRLTEESPGLWRVRNNSGEELVITIEAVEHDSSHDLGLDPGLVKDGVEAHLQELLAEQVELLGAGYTLIRREHPTPIGPVDILVRGARAPGLVVELDDRAGSGVSAAATSPEAGRGHVAVEVKRKAGIDAVEQLTRYVDYLNRDPLLAPVSGVLAAQSIAPQAQVLAEDRGIRCVVLDYEAMRGLIRDDVLF